MDRTDLIFFLVVLVTFGGPFAVGGCYALYDKGRHVFLAFFSAWDGKAKEKP